MPTRLLLPLVTTLSILTTLGCTSEDPRVHQMARESLARQAEQNKEMARQSQQVAEATEKFVAANAEARRDVIKLQRDLQGEVQGERRSLDRQREGLESERRTLAKQRHRAPIIADAISGSAVLLACLLPLVVCIYLLWTLRDQHDPDQMVVDLLVEELASDQPRLLAIEPTANAIAEIPSPADQLTVDEIDIEQTDPA